MLYTRFCTDKDGLCEEDHCRCEDDESKEKSTDSPNGDCIGEEKEVK